MIEIKEIRDLETLLSWRREVIRNVFDIEPTEKLMAANEEYYRTHEHYGHVAFIALVDGVEAGCGGLCFTDELPSPDNESGRCGYLMNIYVREAFRNHGVAHSIVRRLVQEAKERGCGKIYLETTGEGRPVYASLGFVDMPDMMKLMNL